MINLQNVFEFDNISVDRGLGICQLPCGFLTYLLTLVEYFLYISGAKRNMLVHASNFFYKKKTVVFAETNLKRPGCTTIYY